MNEIGRHITNAIEGGKVKNPADIARRLSVQRSTVSRWISGEKAPSAEEARALADLIGAPEGLIMAECEAARAKDDATRAAWLRVARLCSGQAKALTTLALVMLVAASYFFSGDTEALAGSMLWVGSIASNTHYGGFKWIGRPAQRTRSKPFVGPTESPPTPRRPPDPSDALGRAGDNRTRRRERSVRVAPCTISWLPVRTRRHRARPTPSARRI